jgi:thiol-disulfide isomerase/thioredoxin
VACLAALAVATAIGVVWRATNGKMRRPRGAARTGEPVAAPLEIDESVAVLDGPITEQEAAAPRVTATQLGQPLGERVTLVQFSSAFCAPCRATRRILADVAGMTDGVAHIEIDAESRLDLVRALGILRTPTVLVLGADGQIVRRASGQPRKADVIGAIGAAVDAAGPNPYSPGLEAR